MKKELITEFFTRLRAENPDPKSDLEYTNDFTLLVAVVLSAQATDVGVNKAHLFRVGNRTGMAKGKTPEEVERKLEKKIPKEFLLNAHHWLILHGRYICKARKPECGTCIVSDLCKFKDKVV